MLFRSGTVCEATDLPPCAGCEATRDEYFPSGAVPEAECGVIPAAGEAVKGALEKLGDALGIGKKEP